MSGVGALRGGGASRRFLVFCLVFAAISIAAPFLFPAIVKQLSIFWVMVIVGSAAFST